MDILSDDSFVWTDASNSSSIIDNTTKNMKRDTEEYASESEFKKKLQNQLFSEIVTNGAQDKIKAKKRKITIESQNNSSDEPSPTPKKVKIEYETEYETRKKRKKSKKNFDSDETKIDLSDDLSLTTKNVKIESESDYETRKKRKKCKNKLVTVEPKMDISDNLSPTLNNVKIENESDHETRKKSKKSKKKLESDEPNMDLLDALVKTEPPLSPHKSAQRKSKSKVSSMVGQEENTNINTDSLLSENHIEVDEPESELSSISIKKKKKKHKKSEIELEFGDDVLKEKVKAEESIVRSPTRSKKKSKSTAKSSSLEVTADDTQEEPLVENDMDGIDSTLHSNFDTTNPDVVSCTLMNKSSRDQPVSEESDQGHREQRSTVTNVQQRPKISDRIQFEDDIDLKSSERSAYDGSRALWRHVTAHQLQQCQAAAGHATALSEYDELWVLHCPSQVDTLKITDVTLHPDAKSRFKVDNQTYIGRQESSLTDLVLFKQVGQQFVYKSTPTVGVIRFEPKIPKVVIADENIASEPVDFIPLPETKVRHPLFGSDYKEAIKVPDSIAERLRNLYDASEGIATAIKSEKKKRKKQKHQALEVAKEMEIDIEETPYIKKERKRKRKHSAVVPDSEIATDLDSSLPVKKKKKKIKQEITAEAWESEKAIEENLFNF